MLSVRHPYTRMHMHKLARLFLHARVLCCMLYVAAWCSMQGANHELQSIDIAGSLAVCTDTGIMPVARGHVPCACGRCPGQGRGGLSEGGVMSTCNQCKDDANGRDYHGRCLGHCKECGEHLAQTGRYTTYCPSCDTCPDCGCPRVDGFAHYAGCSASEE